MPFPNMRNRCTARSKKTGERCQNPAVTGYKVCYHHGANPKNRGGRKKGCDNSKSRKGRPPKGNTNSMKHGAYSPRLLPDEREHYEAIKKAFEEELGGEEKLSASDRLLVLRLATNGAKITVAMGKNAGPEAVVPLQRLELEMLRELKTTRASKDGGSGMGNTPAEVMAALLMRVKERAAADKSKALPEPVVIDAEVVDADQE